MEDEERLEKPPPGEVSSLRREVADLKLAAARLQKSEEYFRAITQNASDIVIIVDRKGTITYVNPSITRQLGYEPEELIGKSGFDFIVLADIPRAIYDFGRAILTHDTIISNAFTVKHKDGTERVLEGVGTNLLRNPVVKGFVMNVRDVTERKKAEVELASYRKHLEAVVDERTSELAKMNSRLVIELGERRRMEEALRESEARYRGLLEEAPIGFCIVDPQGTIQYVNRWIEKETGWTRDELIERNGFTVGFFDDETSRLLQARLAARLRGEADQLTEIPVVSREGRPFWVEVKDTVLSKDGVSSGIQLIFTDISKRKHMEAECLELQERLHRAEKMEALGTLAGGGCP